MCAGRVWLYAGFHQRPWSPTAVSRAPYSSTSSDCDNMASASHVRGSWNPTVCQSVCTTYVQTPSTRLALHTHSALMLISFISTMQGPNLLSTIVLFVVATTNKKIADRGLRPRCATHDNCLLVFTVAILCFPVKLIKFFFFISVYFVFISFCLPFMVNKRWIYIIVELNLVGISAVMLVVFYLRL